MNKAQKEDYMRLKQEEMSGNFLTVDGLRVVCAGLEHDPEQIGQHFLDALERFKNGGHAHMDKIRSDVGEALPEIKRACIYARVDGEDQEVLDLQIENLKSFAIDKEYLVTSVISTLGTSDEANQRDINTIAELARDDVFDVVLAVNPARISRDSSIYADFVRYLGVYGKMVCFISDMPSQE